MPPTTGAGNITNIDNSVDNSVDNSTDNSVDNSVEDNSTDNSVDNSIRDNSTVEDNSVDNSVEDNSVEDNSVEEESNCMSCDVGAYPAYIPQPTMQYVPVSYIPYSAPQIPCPPQNCNVNNNPLTAEEIRQIIIDTIQSMEQGSN